MADEILKQDKSELTDRTDSVIWVQKDGQATPSTYDDWWMDPDNFLSPEQDRITDNENNIATIGGRLDVVEATLQRELKLNQNASFQWTQPIESGIIEIWIRKNPAASSQPTISIGTTAGGTDIMSSKEVAIPIRVNTTLAAYATAARSIHFTLSVAAADIAIFYRNNIFTT